MRAIDILFDRIDDLHTAMKKIEDVNKKVHMLYQIKSIIDIIGKISMYHIENNENDYM